jgi:ssDNA-specific exonuclease RecJ
VQSWQIYDWRKKARQAAQPNKAATLIPVHVTEPDQAKTEPKQSCSVIIEAQSMRITITGSIEAIVVRSVLECLAR